MIFKKYTNALFKSKNLHLGTKKIAKILSSNSIIFKAYSMIQVKDMAKYVSSNVKVPIKGWFLEPFRMLWIQDTVKYISSTVNAAICKVKFRLMMVNCQLSRQTRCQKLFTGPNPYLVLLPFWNRLARLLYSKDMHH